MSNYCPHGCAHDETKNTFAFITYSNAKLGASVAYKKIHLWAQWVPGRGLTQAVLYSDVLVKSPL